MQNNKIKTLLAILFGLATLVPVLASAQGLNVSASADVNVGAGGPGGDDQGRRGSWGQGQGSGGMMRGPGGGRGMGMRPGAAGTVTTVSGTTITINEMMRNRDDATTTTGKVITIDASKAIIIKDNATSSIGSVAVGDKVMAQGTLIGSNIVATVVRDGMMMRKDNGQGNGGQPGNGGMMRQDDNENGRDTMQADVNANVHAGFFGGMKNFFSRMFHW